MNRSIVDIIDDCSNIKYDIDSEELILNFFCNIQKDINIDIVQNSNSLLILNFSSFVKRDCKVNVNCLMKGNDNKCIINVRCISEFGNGEYNVCVRAFEGTTNNIILEDLKAINENGTVNLLPILEVDTNQVDASHFATVGGYNEDVLFYLMSHGISCDNAKLLLRNSFIYGIYSDDFLKKLKGEENNE